MGYGMSTCIFSKLLDLTAGPHGVVDIDVGWVQSITVEFFYLILCYTVALDVNCSSCNFTERNNLASADFTY